MVLRLRALRPARAIVMTLAVIVAVELAARSLTATPAAEDYRRLLFAPIFLAATGAALLGGTRGGVASGALGALYTPAFFLQYGAASSTGARIAFGSVLGVLLFGTSVYIVRHQDMLRRLSDERVEAEGRRNRELRATNQTLEDFTHVVAHDLRNPVRGLRELSGDLERDLAPKLSAEAQGDIALLRRETARLSDLLEGLLEYSRLTRLAVSDLGPVRVDSVLASDACQLRYAQLVKERGARVEPPAPDAPAALANADAMALVLGNLVANGIKHGRPSGGVVRVRVLEGPAGGVEVRVEDDGPGFSADSRARVGAALEEGAPIRGLGRSGFGLAMVARAVERMGGRVELGEAPGGGAAVIVHLPRAA